MDKEVILQQRNKILRNTSNVVNIEYKSYFHNCGYVETDIHMSQLTRPKLTRNKNLSLDISNKIIYPVNTENKSKSMNDLLAFIELSRK